MSKPVRRSQAISPFGIGALVDFPGPVSLIHAGLDAWPFDESKSEHREFRIEDEKRLANRLNVEYFVQPPDHRTVERGQAATQPNLLMRLPFLRFPLLHVCPRCGRMHQGQFHGNAAPTCTGPIGSGRDKGKQHNPRKTVQVRFVAACKQGHLRDFPWVEWIFQECSPDWLPNGQDRWLRLRSTGSASLTSVEVSAEERDASGGIRVIARRTLGGAFQGDPSSGSPSPFRKIGLTCEGHNPSLAVGGQAGNALPGCGDDLHALLRGASNLYFPRVVSSIYIPEIDDDGLSPELLELLDDHKLKMALLAGAQVSGSGLVTAKVAKIALKQHFPESTVDPSALADAANRHTLPNAIYDNRDVRAYLDQKIQTAEDGRLSVAMLATAIHEIFEDWEIDPSFLVPLLAPRLEGKANIQSSDGLSQDPLAESAYRHQEYRVFCRDVQEGFPKTNLLIKSHPIAGYGDIVAESFDRVSLLHKLRETKAYVGYSRIFPDNDLTPAQRWGLFSSRKRDWLPATIVRGEGIFLRFREERLAAWLAEHGHMHERRLGPLNLNLTMLRNRRNQVATPARPKYVLIHTFAHLIINQLVYECGYGSASLRERIYASDDDNKMSGVLIYTAAGDSEGTMGGLVKMGGPSYLEGVIAKALERARWCSSDPVCIESSGQGPDSCNLGACHSCALLPETSCEEQNRLLDRGVVIGTLERPGTGYFLSAD